MNEIMLQILKKEGLKGWKIEKSKGGNMCWIDEKWISLSNELSMAMFLHELAHALAGMRKEWDKTGHDSIWADKYTELVEKYMVYPKTK